MNKVKKKKVTVKFINPNSTLAYPLFNEHGKEVHPGHELITAEKKKEFLQAGIEILFYYPEMTEKIKKSALQEYIKKHSYKGPRAIRIETQKKAVSVIDNLVKTVKDVLLDVKPADITELVAAIGKDIDDNETEFINLLDAADIDDFLYTHSLNVGILSMLMAKKMRLPGDLIKDIGTGAFLHDIGKIKLPDEIRNKNESLTEQELTIFQEHPILGHEMLEKNYSISDTVKEIILSHHERHNGSGYPNGVAGDDIKDYIQIVSLADYFDTITSNNPNQEIITTQKALEIMLAGSDEFEPVLLRKFIKEVGNVFRESEFYPVDSFVVLNTNELAKVIAIHDKSNFLRPMLKIISNQNGIRLKKPIEVDLKMDYSRHIVRRVEK